MIKNGNKKELSYNEYGRIHSWIKKRKPKPNKCECCGNHTDNLDLSNISGEYKKDITDYEYLCRKCHTSKDREEKYSKFISIRLDSPTLKAIEIFMNDNDMNRSEAIRYFITRGIISYTVE